MPANHEMYHEKMNPGRLLNWAGTIGPSTKEFVQRRFDEAQYVVHVYKGIIAILNRSKIYGKSELELALSYANSINATSVKSIESILSKKLYMQAMNTTSNPAINDHENLRGPQYYK